MIEIREMDQLAQARAPTRAWVDEVADPVAFAALRGPWGALLDASDAGPFLAWEWLFTWWQRLGVGTTPRVLVAREGAGELAGLLPLCERGDGLGPFAVRRWGFLGDGVVGSDYLDAIAARERVEEIAERFAEQLYAGRERFDVLELLDLPQGSALGDAVLRRLAPGALVAERFPRCVCPTIELHGTFEQYLASVGRADNLARRRKWLAAQPGFAIDRVERPEGLADALTEFFHLHELRWERDGGSQGITNADVRGFHRDAARALAECGKLRIYTLRVGSRALASVYAVLHGDRFYYYQSGYDPEWARRSVGLVLLGETIADAFREGRRAFEFLRGAEPYKAEWAKTRRETEGVRVVLPTRAGAAWLARQEASRAVRRAGRRVLGDARWEGLRRALGRGRR